MSSAVESRMHWRSDVKRQKMDPNDWNLLIADHRHISSRTAENRRSMRQDLSTWRNRQAQSIAAQTWTNFLFHASWRNRADSSEKESIDNVNDDEELSDDNIRKIADELDRNLNEAVFMETEDTPIDKYTVFSECMKHLRLHALFEPPDNQTHIISSKTITANCDIQRKCSQVSWSTPSQQNRSPISRCPKIRRESNYNKTFGTPPGRFSASGSTCISAEVFKFPYGDTTSLFNALMVEKGYAPLISWLKEQD